MIIAFAGQKGGVGKTTTAITVAVEFLERGRRVLLVDADPQGTVRTWAEVAAEQEGGQTPTVVAMGAGLHRPDQLPSLAHGYDVSVIDCPPAHGEIQRAALMIADIVILPCTPSPNDVWALGSSIQLVKDACTIRPELVAAIVVTRKKPRTMLSQSVRQAIEGHGLPLLRSELGDREAFAKAILAGTGVTRFEPRSRATEEVHALVDELIGCVQREAADVA